MSAPKTFTNPAVYLVGANGRVWLCVSGEEADPEGLTKATALGMMPVDAESLAAALMHLAQLVREGKETAVPLSVGLDLQKGEKIH